MLQFVAITGKAGAGCIIQRHYEAKSTIQILTKTLLEESFSVIQVLYTAAVVQHIQPLPLLQRRRAVADQGQRPGPDTRARDQGQTPGPDTRARHQGQTPGPDTRAAGPENAAVTTPQQ